MKQPEMRALIEDGLAHSAFTKMLLVQKCVPELEAIGAALVGVLRKGRRLYLFGNGGSAADAQHIAAELVGRFLKNRRALPATALTTDTSVLTAVSNDFDSDDIFSRQVEAHVRKGDAVIAISTSGNSRNVIEGARRARKAGARTIGFTNETGGKLKKLVDLCFRAPSADTQRVQECHITAGHVLCDVIERALFG